MNVVVVRLSTRVACECSPLGIRLSRLFLYFRFVKHTLGCQNRPSRQIRLVETNMSSRGDDGYAQNVRRRKGSCSSRISNREMRESAMA